MADKATTTAEFDSPPSETDIARGQRDDGGKRGVNLPDVPQQAREVSLTGAGGKATTLTGEQLRQLSFEELNAALGVTDASEETDQYGPILSDKHQLIGKPFVIVHWEFHNGTMGGFVSMWIMTQEGNRYIVNDGSTGVYHQLADITKRTGQDSMLACKHGLRVSQYETEINGKMTPAETFYIDTKL